MLEKVILLEGVNDLAFIKWLLVKANVLIPANMRLAQVGGKPKIKSYIYDILIARVMDNRNDIDYEDAEVTKILLIKDYDLDDNINEFTDLIKNLLRNNQIVMDKYYISGYNNPPRLLESILIENDGEFLRSYATAIKCLNQHRKDNNQDYFRRMNDKLIFHSYQKLHNASPEYNDRAFNSMFSEDFLELTDIKNLINRIKRFIEE